MQMSKKGEFLAVLLTLCTVVMVVVLLLDIQIKAAILEESTKLRLTIEDEEVRQSGRRRQETNADRVSNDAPNDAPIPSNVLVVKPAGMEAGSASNGTEKPVPSPRVRRSKSGRPASDRTVPQGNGSVGT